MACRGIWSLTGLITCSLIASAASTIFDFLFGSGSLINGMSTSGYRFMATLSSTWMLAVIGNARKAPAAPNIEPKNRTVRNAMQGFRSIVRSEIFGESTRFSICWYTVMNTTTPMA